MKTDIQTSNESVSPNSRELLILKKYFPQCFSKPDTDENGGIIKEHFDIEKLVEVLRKDEVDIKKEGFTLNFLGKSYAHYQSNLDSETVIVPDEKNSESSSENIYIVGDNLDVLQHLKYSYAEKIKCIYIDPPYNTGKDDFVYNDKFGFTAKDLVEKLDISEDEAERICSMKGKCTHSAWLTFMYPRLAIARELLREDGVIFISIDDNEQANLKRLCDEVFGEGNYVNCFAWVSNITGRQISGKGAAKTWEYIFCYAKNIESISTFNIDINFAKKYLPDTYKGFEKDIREDFLGKYAVGDTLYNHNRKFNEETRPNLVFSIFYNPKTEEIVTGKIGEKKEGFYELKPHSNGDGFHKYHAWRWSKDKIANEKYNLIVLPSGKNDYEIYTKIRDFNNTTLKDLITNISNGDDEVQRLFEGKKYFNYPKSTNLLKTLIAKLCRTSTPETALAVSNPCDNSDIILDFFSGSGTTAHAVMDLNASDNGRRKFIMVQLDESVKKGSEAEKAGFKTIDEIGQERIRRAAAKIKAEHPDTTADLGFKTYYLKSMPKETLDKIKTFNPNALFTSDGDIVKSLGEKTLLQTWQIKDGFGFNAKPRKIDLAGYIAYLLDDEKIGKYLYLLGEIEEKSVKELIRKIESLELTLDKIFIYGYSFDFNMLNSIKTNLKTLKNRNPIEPIVRY